MIAMTELPLVKGNHKEAMGHSSHDVIEQRVDRKRAVAAVMAHYEQREEERALNCPVDDDRRQSQDKATCPRFHQPQSSQCQHDLPR